MVHAGFPPQWTLAQALGYGAEVAAALARRPDELYREMYGDGPDRWERRPARRRATAIHHQLLHRLRFVQPEGIVNLRLKVGPAQAPSPWVPCFARRTGARRQPHRLRPLVGARVFGRGQRVVDRHGLRVGGSADRAQARAGARARERCLPRQRESRRGLKLAAVGLQLIVVRLRLLLELDAFLFPLSALRSAPRTQGSCAPAWRPEADGARHIHREISQLENLQHLSAKLIDQHAIALIEPPGPPRRRLTDCQRAAAPGAFIALQRCCCGASVGLLKSSSTRMSEETRSGPTAQ